MRIGIVGLGTIGQALAQALDRGEVAAQLTAVHSRNMAQAQAFAHTLSRVPEVVDLAGVIAHCALVIEAATQEALSAMAPAILKAGKDLMVLSVAPCWIIRSGRPWRHATGAGSMCRQGPLLVWMASRGPVWDASMR